MSLANFAVVVVVSDTRTLLKWQLVSLIFFWMKNICRKFALLFLAETSNQNLEVSTGVLSHYEQLLYLIQYSFQKSSILVPNWWQTWAPKICLSKWANSYVTFQCCIKIVEGGDNISNAQKEVLDTNFEPKIGLLLYILYQGSRGIYQGKCLTLWQATRLAFDETYIISHLQRSL